MERIGTMELKKTNADTASRSNSRRTGMDIVAAIDLETTGLDEARCEIIDMAIVPPSAVGRAAVGTFLLGPVGLLAGVTAKRKGIYTIALEYHKGGKSLIEIDEKRYKLLIKKMF